MTLVISDGAKKILERLNNKGYSAYVVGGAVRDLIMGKTPHDYDISTDASPDTVKALFSKTVDTGIKHGTVTVIENNIAYEITTFRRDGEYSDGRHPEDVEFVKNPRTDCLRRDFTINAMMYNPKTGIMDYFCGKRDINKKIIRCVGTAEIRFKEDALRMLRAIRFKAQLGFEIEEKTAQAIKKCAVLIKKVSRERIVEEMNKILLSDNPDSFRDMHNLGILKFIIPELDRCFGEEQRNKYHIYDVGEHIMHTVMNTPKDLVLRWAALLHDTGKPCCSSVDANGIIHFYGHHRESRRITVDVLHKYRMDSNTIRDIAMLVENHDYRVEPNLTAVKKMMAKTGAELFEKLLILQKADNTAKNPAHLPEKLKRINSGLNIYREVLASKQPYRISELVVNGRDLMEIGYRQGREIGDTLKALLDEVIIKPELNNRQYLMRRANEMRKKRR